MLIKRHLIGLPMRRRLLVNNMDEVSYIQKLLNLRGYSVLMDGIYGAHTRDAVYAFQRERGLRETGEIDVDTLNALEV